LYGAELSDSVELMRPGDQLENASARKDVERAPGTAEATPCVLVVEDEPAVGEITCRMVRDAGYLCEWVRTGKEAVALVGSGSLSADLFIIDIVLPDISGIEVARQLAQRYPIAPVIFISAYPEYRLEPPVVERGRFLPKPYSAAELAQVLHELLPLLRDRSRIS
jgi:two-component system cell cycle sensor histidine kinase/response regulator CckA